MNLILLHFSDCPHFQSKNRFISDWEKMLEKFAWGEHFLVVGRNRYRSVDSTLIYEHHDVLNFFFIRLQKSQTRSFLRILPVQAQNEPVKRLLNQINIITTNRIDEISVSNDVPRRFLNHF